MLLRMRDVQPQLQDKWLQLYWPDDSRWWPAQVIHVNLKRHRALLLYETGLLLLAFVVQADLVLSGTTAVHLLFVLSSNT